MSYLNLSIEQYPEVVPPTIQVTASYPGANSKTVSRTVATPIEQEVNGVENMLYMSSQSTDDGQMVLTISFEIGTNLDLAQIQVQNRVAIAEPRLPEAVRQLGITTKKNSPNLMLVINMFSPTGKYDQAYIGNYAVLYIQDRIKRLKGVGEIRLVGASEYAMRVWLNPDLMNSYNITPTDVLAALRTQNVQVASGKLNQEPQPSQLGFEYNIETKGRLYTVDDFLNIIIKSGNEGQIVRLKDVGTVNLGSQSYLTKGHIGKYPTVALPVFQRPGTNALDTSEQIITLMKDISKNFPPGLEYKIAYNPTKFVGQSIDAVKRTIIEAALLVILVICIFLQSWRASLIPIISIPVSLIGTFFVMDLFGLSLNTLTLFGLVLAIGIVVDDAIVVVESMDRNIREGLSIYKAAKKTMDEVGSALIAMGLVVIAVFVPTLFLSGLTGQFYSQFGFTVSIATMISVFVSLTLSPALSVILLKGNASNQSLSVSKYKVSVVSKFLSIFEKGFKRIINLYGWLILKLARHILFVLLIFIILLVYTFYLFYSVPTGFIPKQDQGYFIVSVQLPSGASLTRTEKVVKKAIAKMKQVPGIEEVVAFTGFSGATFTNATNAAAIFPTLASFDKRIKEGQDYYTVLSNIKRSLSTINEASVVVIPPPPIRGIGNAGGFKLMLQDREGRGSNILSESAGMLINKINGLKEVASAYTFFDNKSPRIYLDFSREKAERLNIPVSNVIETLEVFLGSLFVNEFNYFGRTYRVIVQADAPYRLTPDDILRIKVRSSNGHMVPVGSFATLKNSTGPNRVPRYNLFPAIDIIGDSSPGYSSLEAIRKIEEIAEQNLPDGIGYEWTEIAYQEKQAGNTATIAFALSLVFVFLFLAAQFESLKLPFIILLIVPMSLLSSMIGIKIFGIDNNIMTQIGFVTLIALAAKNSILLVEYANQIQKQGSSRWRAAIKAGKLRLRPILMTAFSFILGVLPLVISQGAGSEMRQALGIAVFSGMLGVTIIGLIFTPLFYIFVQGLKK